MKSLYPPTHVKTRARVLMGWALVLALVITILSSGLGLTVQAEEGQEEQPQQEQRQEQVKGITVFYHDVIKGKDWGGTTGWPMVDRGNSLKLQYKLTGDSYSGNAISGLEVRLVDANDPDNTNLDFDKQTTDENGMVTFEVTEEQVKAISHREPSKYGTDYLPETYPYGFLATEDGGYNKKLIAYHICLQHDETTIKDKTYRAGINLAPYACFTFKDTKVCKLELTPMTLDYGATFNPMDLITKVSTDKHGVIKDVDVKKPDTAAKTLFTYQNEDGEIVNAIDTTKPGVYKVTVQVFPFGNDEKNKWCWDTQTTTVTVKPDASEYLLTFDPSGGNWNGDSAIKTFPVKKGQNFTIIPAPAREGYEFLYWKGSEYQPGDSYVVEGDHTFTAEWVSSETPCIKFPMCPTTVVQSVTPIPPVAQPTAVTPLKLPATGSVDAGLTIWLSLGLALAGLWLKKRN